MPIANSAGSGILRILDHDGTQGTKAASKHGCGWAKPAAFSAKR
jgi:hypothetical protein